MISRIRSDQKNELSFPPLLSLFSIFIFDIIMRMSFDLCIVSRSFQIINEIRTSDYAVMLLRDTWIIGVQVRIVIRINPTFISPSSKFSFR